MFNKMRIRSRMIFSICAVMFIAFFLTISFVTIKAREMAKTGAEERSEEMAYRYGYLVQARLEIAMDAARNLSHTLEGIKKAGDAQRILADEIQKQILERNVGFIGVWTCWEPNAFDEKDNEFKNKQGHDDTGRYIPYWNRGQGIIAVEPLLDYEKEGTGDYYLLAKKSQKETILNPYLYPIGGKEVLITSVVSPIIINGEFLGVAGVDISLSEFEDLISTIKPYETGYGYIVSNNGILVAHPKKDIIGKDFIERQTEDVREYVRKSIESGKKYSLYKISPATGIDSYQILTPINIGKTTTPWSFIISIPTDKIFENANEILYYSVLLCVFFLIVLSVMIYFIAENIAKPIRIAAEGARRFSIGDIKLEGMDWDEIGKINARGDELGDIGRAFSALINYQQKKTEEARSIADGLLDVEVSLASKEDVLGGAFEVMVRSLREIVSELHLASNQVDMGARQVADSSQSLSQGATESASSLEEITSSMAEISIRTKTNAENATEASRLATDARVFVKDGVNQMSDMTDAMEEIRSSGGEIAKIIKVIDDIAFQTNLLALNAAVEAARAGKHGKGFAVVAQEVRNLAARSARSAQETGELIEGAINRTEKGVEIAVDTQKALEKIAKVVEGLVGLIEKIAISSNEQAQGISQVSLGLSQIESVTQQGTANAEETSAAAEELSGQATQMRSLLARFKLHEEEGGKFLE